MNKSPSFSLHEPNIVLLVGGDCLADVTASHIIQATPPTTTDSIDLVLSYVVAAKIRPA